VGVPSFSIGEGMKYKGHDAAWGEAQAQDYVDHHYHQPSDEYRPEWDFAGLAKMTQFGFVLGRQAAMAPELQGWQPGDEFEAARKKSQAQAAVRKTFFEKLPALHLVSYEPIHYPPLALQTQITGVVHVRVVVDQGGSVSNVVIVDGHPLLMRAVENNVRAWKFEPLTVPELQFELSYEFKIREKPDLERNEDVSFVSPQHVLLVASRPPMDTLSSKRQVEGTRNLLRVSEDEGT
jgi:TonB family protein